MARINYDDIVNEYCTGRALSDESITAWMHLAGRYIPRTRDPILDLGAGTGRFSAALAECFGVPVLAIEPAMGMLRHAPHAPRPRVHHAGVYRVAGIGEAVPCRPAVFQAVWMSQVVHHLDSLPSCAAELRRVLRKGGGVLLRGAFGAEGADIPLFRYFPGAFRVSRSFPSLESIEDTFGRAGLEKIGHELHSQVIASSLRALTERFRLRADSTLQLLPEQEFEEGMRELERESSSEGAAEPVREDIELVVFAAS